MQNIPLFEEGISRQKSVSFATPISVSKKEKIKKKSTQSLLIKVKEEKIKTLENLINNSNSFDEREQLEIIDLQKTIDHLKFQIESQEIIDQENEKKKEEKSFLKDFEEIRKIEHDLKNERLEKDKISKKIQEKIDKEKSLNITLEKEIEMINELQKETLLKEKLEKELEIEKLKKQEFKKYISEIKNYEIEKENSEKQLLISQKSKVKSLMEEDQESKLEEKNKEKKLNSSSIPIPPNILKKFNNEINDKSIPMPPNLFNKKVINAPMIPGISKGNILAPPPNLLKVNSTPPPNLFGPNKAPGLNLLGINNNQGTTKKKREPTKKLKPVMWKIIPGNQVKNTVWEKMDDFNVNFLNFKKNFSLFEIFYLYFLI